ncbi:MAG: DCC1-like thiol-disulfide oxidoreductase family protein [Acidobacteria bacterium]|nr:DCC1-like thiol-disulfide oxidoreductase family protein [Acidobacteriota bacterium]
MGKASMAHVNASRLVLFDGICGLCARTVRFVLRHDREGRFVYAPLQGEVAAAVLARHSLASDLETMIYVADFDSPTERVFSKSDAILAILDELGGLWSVVAMMRILPRAIRDTVYSLVARYRYAWFGRFETCQLPAPEQRDRFLP